MSGLWSILVYTIKSVFHSHGWSESSWLFCCGWTPRESTASGGVFQRSCDKADVETRPHNRCGSYRCYFGREDSQGLHVHWEDAEQSVSGPEQWEHTMSRDVHLLQEGKGQALSHRCRVINGIGFVNSTALYVCEGKYVLSFVCTNAKFVCAILLVNVPLLIS